MRNGAEHTFAPFRSWFTILTRKLLKLDFLASVNLILKYRFVPRCTENKGTAVPLNSKQAVRRDRGNACNFRERDPVSIVQEAEWADLDSMENLGSTGSSIAGPYLPMPSRYTDYGIRAYPHANRTWYCLAVSYQVVTTLQVKCGNRVGNAFVNLTENNFITNV